MTGIKLPIPVEHLPSSAADVNVRSGLQNRKVTRKGDVAVHDFIELNDPCLQMDVDTSASSKFMFGTVYCRRSTQVLHAVSIFDVGMQGHFDISSILEKFLDHKPAAPHLSAFVHGFFEALQP